MRRIIIITGCLFIALAGFGQADNELYFTWPAASFSSYSRSLRLDSAISVTSWRRGAVLFRQEVIVSAPANAIIVHLKASRPGGLRFTAAISRKERAAISYTENSALMRGSLDGGNGEEGIRYVAGLSLVPVDGTVRRSGDGLVVSAARNGFSLDFCWKKGIVTQLKVSSGYGRVCRIASMSGAVVKDEQGRRVPCSTAGGVLTFVTRAGNSYIIKPE